jgi:hypothetical protein
MLLYDGGEKNVKEILSPVLGDGGPKASDFTLTLALSHQGRGD